MATELKPCPFCGGEAKRYGGGLSQEAPVTACTACFTQVIGHELWNNRPAENKLKAAAVREALQYEPKWRVYGAEAQLHAIDEYADKIEKGEL